MFVNGPGKNHKKIRKCLHYRKSYFRGSSSLFDSLKSHVIGHVISQMIIKRHDFLTKTWDYFDCFVLVS